MAQLTKTQVEALVARLQLGVVDAPTDELDQAYTHWLEAAGMPDEGCAMELVIAGSSNSVPDRSLSAVERTWVSNFINSYEG